MPTATSQNGAASDGDVRAAAARPVLRIVKPVPIELDRPRSLVMDFEAMARFEDATGVSAWSREAWNGTRYLPALVWAGLLHEDPDLTLEEVKSWRDIFHLANIGYLSERLGELWGATMPEAEPAAEEQGHADPNQSRRAG
jgi:hypothetical protein